MKSRISKEKAVPVPERGKNIKRKYGKRAKKCAKGIVAAVTLLVLAGGSVCVGMQQAPQTDIPVALSNGEVITPPWYITVNGKKTVLVESEETAEAVIDEVIDGYKDDPDNIVDVRVMEDTGTEKMDIKHGDDPPDILTAAEAEEQLIEGNEGESYLTVVVTREEKDVEAIEHEEKYKPEPTMYIGETEVESEGEDGLKETTKKVVCENGKIVDEEIIEEETLKEPIDRIILTGTKNYDGYGGGSITAADSGVSYDPEAAYDCLLTPVPSVCISSPYGPRGGRLHGGIDLALAQGSDIYAADSGTVYYAGYSGGYGNLVKIDHGNGMQTYYAHCSRLLVSAGQAVEAGEKIALVGSTGNSTGPHLHFEVIINGTRVDPADFLDLQ